MRTCKSQSDKEIYDRVTGSSILSLEILISLTINDRIGSIQTGVPSIDLK